MNTSAAFLQGLAHVTHVLVAASPPPVPAAAPGSGATAVPSPGGTSSATPATPVFGLPTLILSVLVWLPTLFAIGISLAPSRSRDDRSRLRTLGLVASGVVLLLMAFEVSGQIALASSSGGRLGFGQGSDVQAASCVDGAAFCEYHAWLFSFPITSFYHLDADGISLPLLILSCVIFFSALFTVWRRERDVKQRVVSLLVLETAVNGALSAQDYVLVLLFWGMMLAPLYLLIRERIPAAGAAQLVSRAAGRFLGYSLAGFSAFTLAVVLLAVHIAPQFASLAATGSPVVPTFDTIINNHSTQLGLEAAGFALMMVSAVIALGAFPAHRWLVLVVSEADPTVGAVLVGIVTRLGGYAILRFAFQAYPDVSGSYGYVLVVLGVLSAGWGVVGALGTGDLRRLVAYLGLTQTGLLLLALGSENTLGLLAAVMLLVASGLSQAMLVWIAGVVEDRAKTRRIDALGGLAGRAPRLVALWTVAVLSALGIPLLAGFNAELMAYLAAFGVHRIATALVMLAALGAGVTLLWTGQRIFYGPERESLEKVKDAGDLDIAYLTPPIILLLLWGLLPGGMMTLIANASGAITTLWASH